MASLHLNIDLSQSVRRGLGLKRLSGCADGIAGAKTNKANNTATLRTPLQKKFAPPDQPSAMWSGWHVTRWATFPAKGRELNIQENLWQILDEKCTPHGTSE